MFTTNEYKTNNLNKTMTIPRSKILEWNGIDPGLEEQEAQRLLLIILKDNAEECGYEMKTKDHQEPLLRKYLYFPQSWKAAQRQRGLKADFQRLARLEEVPGQQGSSDIP